MHKSTPVQVRLLTGLHALPALKIRTTSILVGCRSTLRQFSTKYRVLEIVKINKKNPIFRVVVFNCAKGLPLKLTGSRFCEGHLAIILDNEEEELSLKYIAIPLFMTCHILFRRMI